MGSAFVPESVGSFTGDDDKVYFFFSERAVEYDCYSEQVVARVARVCKVPSSAVVGSGSPEGLAGADQPCLLAIWPGRHGGSTDPAEEVDHVLEGSVGVLSPGLESLLQPASGGAHPAGRLLAQHHLLRGFSSAMVSGCGVAGGREEQVVR